MTEGLDHLAPWLGDYLQKLEPRERRKLARKIGKSLRDANGKRVRDNVKPDGSAMEPAKARRDKRGRLRKRKGRMYPKIALARNLRAKASADRIVVDFRPLVSRTAEVHQFGEVAPVDPKIRNSIKVRYPERPLLGFAPADVEAIQMSIMEQLER